MKTTIKIFTLFVAFYLASCSESAEMLTIINSDGSCSREFTTKANLQFITGDSIESNNPFPVDIDSTCQISWRFQNSEWFTQFPISRAKADSIIKCYKSDENLNTSKEVKSDEFNVVLCKKYNSVQDMATNFKFSSSHEWSKIKVDYSLEKKFRWFYTYYFYKEKYPKIVSNFKISIEKFMTKDEAQFWFTGKPNILKGMNGIEIKEYVGRLEDCANRWYGQNMWNNEFKCLIANYEQIKDKPVSIEKLASLRDTIFNSNVKEYDKIEMNEVLNSYFKTDVFTVLWKDETSPMRKYEDALENSDYMTYFQKSINYKLILPGKVIQPENVVMLGDTLVWKLTAYRMAQADYVIEAQSHKANIWAFVLTGLVLIIAIYSFIWKPKRR